MQSYIDEISSHFQSGNLSISGYSVKQLHSSPIYGELLEGIRHKAGNSMRSPEFLKELGITALGQILPPGAYSIWAIWQSNYENKTLQYQLRALKSLAKLNDKEISPEEFISLSGREILTIEVIDEHGIGSQNQGGKFHLYDDGRIVRNTMLKKEKLTSSLIPFQKIAWEEYGNWTQWPMEPRLKFSNTCRWRLLSENKEPRSYGRVSIRQTLMRLSGY
ncbi:hypothetical protein [Cytobacillus oceanisediminis]|uniref:hypothetical protein n=1 Tax=Cytobacillus oceanisediminis TaxID=665099 RepID=UPI00203F3A7E|nr:hypothetical protein [Cytobacillus oceanisediminis]MCM3404873.1 hypothetical protein [Cytobacillus oceanisediminis]MDK7669019.1 hypothetical protein [Cytobacillus oceanisediminis]